MPHETLRLDMAKVGQLRRDDAALLYPQPVREIAPDGWIQFRGVSKEDGCAVREKVKDYTSRGEDGLFKDEQDTLLHLPFDIRLRDGHAGCRSI